MPFQSRSHAAILRTGLRLRINRLSRTCPGDYVTSSPNFDQATFVKPNVWSHPFR